MSWLNSRKIQIIQCLSDGQWWTTPQVCEECGLSLTNVAELLRRYHVQGLVNRERNPGVPIGYLYRITNTGLERLNYLTSDITQTSSAVADLAGLSGAKKPIFDRWVVQGLRR